MRLSHGIAFDLLLGQRLRAAEPRARRRRPCAGSRRTRAASSCPTAAGSVVSSVTSTRRTYGFFASCLRSKMDVSSPVTQERPARRQTAAMASAGRRSSPPARRGSDVAHGSTSRHGRAPWPTPRWQWTHCTASSRVVLPRDDVVHEVAVTAQAVLLQDPRVARLDHDRLVEVLKVNPFECR